MAIFDTPNPAGSPLEKLYVPRKTWAGAGKTEWEYLLRAEGVDPTLAASLALAFQKRSEQQLLDAEANYREIEHWANIHTHAGTSGVETPPLDAERTILASFDTSGNLGRYRATTGETIWNVAGSFPYGSAVHVPSGDIFRADGTNLVRQARADGAITVVGALPQKANQGGRALIFSPDWSTIYYAPIDHFTDPVRIYALDPADASVIWQTAALDRSTSELAISPDGSKLYIAERDSLNTTSGTAWGYLTEITASNGAMSRVADLLMTSDALDISPDGNRLYVYVMGTGVREFNLETSAFGWTLTSDSDVQTKIAVHPVDGAIYNVREVSGVKYLFKNAADSTEITSRSYGVNTYELLVDPSGLQVYFGVSVTSVQRTFALDPDSLTDIWEGDHASRPQAVAYADAL